MSESAIAPALQRLLADAKAESRQQGMKEIAQTAAKCFTGRPREEAFQQVIQLLQIVEKEQLHNTQATYRRGGLISIKAIAQSVPPGGSPNAPFVQRLFGCVLPLFRDQDPSVRIAAAEATLDIVRKFSTPILSFAFTELFSAMFGAVRDKDQKVVTAGRELSNMVKQLVSDSSSEEFDVGFFVAFLSSSLNTTDPAAIHWLLEWITHVHDIPKWNLFSYLHQYLGCLFRVLQVPDCGAHVESVLCTSLDDVRARSNEIDLRCLFLIAIDFCSSQNSFTQEKALEWTQALLRLGKERLLIDLHRVAPAVVAQLGARDDSIRTLAKDIDDELQTLVILHAPQQPPPPPPSSAALTSPPQLPTTTTTAITNSSSTDISSSPDAAFMLSVSAPLPIATAPLEVSKIQFGSLVQILVKDHLRNVDESVCIGSLDWIGVINRVRPEVIREHIDFVLESLIGNLNSYSPRVLERCINALHFVAGTERFDKFVELSLLEVCRNSAGLLPKLPDILKQLQIRYQGEKFETCEKLFLKIAEIAPALPNKRFVEKVVITLNTMLLTSKELLPLREVLKLGIVDDRARTAFMGLYKCWVYDSVAAIALCLLTTAYSQAHRLVVYLGSLEISSASLVQLDRLTQLFESPVFAYLRTALLQPRKNASLIKALFGIQMILPQTSPQFRLLHNRLKAVPSVSSLLDDEDIEDPKLHTQRKQLEEGKVPKAEWQSMVQLCRVAQQQILAYELQQSKPK